MLLMDIRLLYVTRRKAVNTNLCEIAVVLDRSGSMGAVRSDAIHGFNTLLEDQKKVPGEATLSLVLFNTNHVTVHENVALDKVPPLTEASYVPSGGTALLDAVGWTIDSIGKRLANTPEARRPGRVIVAILTDGEENSSREYTSRARVAEMIKHQQEQYGWEFVFLGANMDAFAEAQALNIPVANAASFVNDAIGTQTAMHDMSATVRSLRMEPAGDTARVWGNR